jgi:hypothetical protein
MSASIEGHSSDKRVRVFFLVLYGLTLEKLSPGTNCLGEPLGSRTGANRPCPLRACPHIVMPSYHTTLKETLGTTSKAGLALENAVSYIAYEHVSIKNVTLI